MNSFQALGIDPQVGGVSLRLGSGQALDALSDVLDELLPFDVRVLGHPAIWAHHRRIDDADCYFLANTDLDNGGAATVQLRGTGRLESWDPATGEVRPLSSRQLSLTCLRCTVVRLGRRRATA